MKLSVTPCMLPTPGSRQLCVTYMHSLWHIPEYRYHSICMCKVDYKIVWYYGMSCARNEFVT